jgi:hypothetical protein
MAADHIHHHSVSFSLYIKLIYFARPVLLKLWTGRHLSEKKMRFATPEP